MKNSVHVKVIVRCFWACRFLFAPTYVSWVAAAISVLPLQTLGTCTTASPAEDCTSTTRTLGKVCLRHHRAQWRLIGGWCERVGWPEWYRDVVMMWNCDVDLPFPSHSLYSTFPSHSLHFPLPLPFLYVPSLLSSPDPPFPYPSQFPILFTNSTTTSPPLPPYGLLPCQWLPSHPYAVVVGSQSILRDPWTDSGAECTSTRDHVAPAPHQPHSETLQSVTNDMSL